MEQDKWMRHFKANLTAASLEQFTDLWTELQSVQSSPGLQDSILALDG